MSANKHLNFIHWKMIPFKAIQIGKISIRALWTAEIQLSQFPMLSHGCLFNIFKTIVLLIIIIICCSIIFIVIIYHGFEIFISYILRFARQYEHHHEQFIDFFPQFFHIHIQQQQQQNINQEIFKLSEQAMMYIFRSKGNKWWIQLDAGVLDIWSKVIKRIKSILNV